MKKERKKPVQVTARTLAILRREGWVPAVVEKWIPFTKRRRDLFGFGDILAFRPDRPGVLLVQCTTASNQANRLAKIAAEPNARKWLAQPGRLVEVWGWAKRGGRGERKVWKASRYPVTLATLVAFKEAKA